MSAKVTDRQVFREHRSLPGRHLFAALLNISAATLALLYLQPARMWADTYWNVPPGQSGDWSMATNWTAGLPSSGNGGNAYVTNGGTATISKSGAACSWLRLGGADGGTIQMTGGRYSGGIVAGEKGVGSFIQSAGSVICSSSVFLGYYSGDNGSYSLSGSGEISAPSECVGGAGTGTFTQTGGSNAISYWLLLGNGSTSSGTYNLSGGQLLTPEEDIGSYSNGGPSTALFQQTGGLNATKYLRIDTLGTYRLNGGTLQINAGLINLGTFEGGDSPASISVAANSVVNFAAGAFSNVGATSMSVGAGSLLIVPQGFDPVTGFRSFQTQGLTHVAGTPLTVGTGQSISGWSAINDAVTCQGTITATSASPLSFSSGRLDLTGGLTLLGNGSVNLGRGALTTDKNATSAVNGGSLITQTQYVGYAGTGNMLQTAGTNSVGLSGWQASLYLGYNSGSNGTYNLSGTGQLTVWENEYVGYSGTGTFTQSAGTHRLAETSYPNGAIYLGYKPGSNGTYNLSGSGQLSAMSEYVASPGAIGLFQQSGGTNTAQYISVGPGGQYQLSGGTLQLTGGIDNAGVFDCSDSAATIAATNSILNFASGVWRNTGGVSVNVTGTSSLVILPPGFDPLTGFRAYHCDGVTHTAGTTLTIAAGQTISGWASIPDPVVCLGKITASGGFPGSINLNNGLILSGSGSASLGMGKLTVNDATSSMSGGSLSLSQMYVGCSGAGVFTQTGGTFQNRTNPGLILGFDAGDTGAYNLSNSGQVSGCQVVVGYSGTGTFVQSGGTFSGFVSIAQNPGAIGTYRLDGPGSLSAFEDVGIFGTGTFIQNGGTNTASALTLASSPGSSGTYNLNGGLLTLAALSGGSGMAAFNFNGGTMKASAAFSSSLPITLGTSGGNATVDTGSYTMSLSGAVSGPGNLVKVGSGALTLAGANAYTGGTKLNAGRLNINSPTALGAGLFTISGASTIDNTSGSPLIVLNNNPQVWNADFTFAGTQDLSLGAGPVTLGGNRTVTVSASTLAVGGPISGSDSLTKAGNGVLSLGGASLYTGSTTVSAGTLAVNGSLASGSPVTVQNGGTLGGTGTVGSVTINSGGHLAPGNSIGTLTLMGDLTLAGGAFLEFELGPPRTCDLIFMPANTLSLNGQDLSTINISPQSHFGPGNYVLIDAGYLAGTGLGPNTSGTIGGLSATLSLDSVNKDLVLTVVPEPCTAALLGIGAVGLLAYTWRRQRRGV